MTVERPRARYRQVADDLRQAIARGDFAPGDMLPSRPELARRYGLNQTSINRAITADRRVQEHGARRRHARVPLPRRRGRGASDRRGGRGRLDGRRRGGGRDAGGPRRARRGRSSKRRPLRAGARRGAASLTAGGSHR
ncbi:MAG: GntR family transcriptional regulator [Actinomadura rubrobrunea]|nr:GntR family transcriptional regulator [Actinomadura rubrobrunea]